MAPYNSARCDIMTLINIVPVVLTNGTKQVKIYAMLDSGSELRLIHRNGAKKLNLRAIPSCWCIEASHLNEPSY